jgi:hypothetical protein
MNGAGLESGARPSGFIGVPNPEGLYHSGNILRLLNTICDGIVMRWIVSGAKARTPDFPTGLVSWITLRGSCSCQLGNLIL